MTSPRAQFTGKERDAETGLDYFGARYLSSAQGRWVSPDPTILSREPENPQSWNRYAYVFNRPTALVDNDGRWPAWYHHWLIENAFLRTLGSHAVQVIEKASDDMDDWLYGGQSAARAYQHGMRDGTTDETVELAAARAQVFIDNSIEYAVTAQLDFEAQGGTGYSDHALTAFGEALHTVQDETSPQHAGFQQWFGLDGPTAWAKAKAHAHEENIAARSKALSDVIARAEAQQATLDLWAKFQKELDSERERRKEELQKQGSQPSPNSGNQ